MTAIVSIVLLISGFVTKNETLILASGLWAIARSGEYIGEKIKEQKMDE